MFNTLKEVPVGSSVLAEAKFVLPLTIDISNVLARYVLQDDFGVEYISGNASSLTNSTELNRLNVLASASLTVPGNIPVTKKGTQYQIMWILERADGAIVSTYIEMIVIVPNSYDVFGIPDIVEVATDVSRIEAILPIDDEVNIQLYGNNSLLYESSGIVKHSDVANGYLYKHTISALKSKNITPKLDPYTILWQYAGVDGESVVEDGYIYLITPSILNAAKDLQSAVNIVRSSARAETLDIDMNVLIHFLKIGVDMFNATGMPTYFTMMNCQGPIRAYWLALSEIALLRSQYLKEAERAFNLQGQSVTLDIDMTTYYDQAASAKQSWVDQYIPDFKRNLNRRGITTGDGNLMHPGSRNYGSMGVSTSPVSNYYSFYNRMYDRFR